MSSHPLCPDDCRVTGRGWAWLAAGALGGLALLGVVGLDTADKLGSVIGALTGLIALGYTVAQNGTRRQERPPDVAPDVVPDVAPAITLDIAEEPAAALLQEKALLTAVRRLKDNPLPELSTTDPLPLRPTPQDPLFRAAADATCPICGAVLRIGIRRPDRIPRPGTGTWLAASGCALITAAVTACELWFVPHLISYGFTEAPARGLGEEIFNYSFTLVPAAGSVLIPIVLARWTRNMLRTDPIYTQRISGPEDPDHVHRGFIRES